MGGSVWTARIRGVAALAKAVTALCQYLGFLVLSGAERQSRLKKRYGWEVIFPRTVNAVRWGEKVGTDLGRRAWPGLSPEGSI